MTEEKRFYMLDDIRRWAEKDDLNILTIYCLVATMTDERFKEFHQEFKTKYTKHDE